MWRILALGLKPPVVEAVPAMLWRRLRGIMQRSLREIRLQPAHDGILYLPHQGQRFFLIAGKHLGIVTGISNIHTELGQPAGFGQSVGHLRVGRPQQCQNPPDIVGPGEQYLVTHKQRFQVLLCGLLRMKTESLPVAIFGSQVLYEIGVFGRLSDSTGGPIPELQFPRTSS